MRLMHRIAILILLVPCIVIGTAFAGLDEGRNALENGDYSTALIELQPLADQNYAEAQVLLGEMYLTGRGTPQDDRQAVAWYRKAAGQGYAPAQHNLGFSYFNGRGVPQDDQQAVEWYRKAAAQGFAASQNNLGVMYQGGRGGLPQDDRQAAQWYRKAAEQGIADALLNLGNLYLNGQGVPRDDVLAYMLFNLAASSGDKTAASNRTSLAQRLSLKQIEQANEFASMWRPGRPLPTDSEIMNR